MSFFRTTVDESSRPSSSPSHASEANSNDASSLDHNSASSSSLEATRSSPARQTHAEPDSSGAVWNSDTNANPCSPASGSEVEGNEASAVQSPHQPNCIINPAMHHPGLVNDAGPDSPASPQQGGVLVNSPVDSSSSSSSSPAQMGGSGDDDRVSGLLSSNSPAAGTDSSSVAHNEDLVNEIDRKESHSNLPGGEVHPDAQNDEPEDDDNFE